MCTVGPDGKLRLCGDIQAAIEHGVLVVGLAYLTGSHFGGEPGDHGHGLVILEPDAEPLETLTLEGVGDFHRVGRLADGQWHYAQIREV